MLVQGHFAAKEGKNRRSEIGADFQENRMKTWEFYIKHIRK